MSAIGKPEGRADTLKRALFALQDVRSRLEIAERGRREPVAIVGMACRFPGADNPEALWNLLQHGVDATGELAAERWRRATAPPRGGFLGEIDGFDAPFFGIAADEAMVMDPQQRLLLEVAWEALENAGVTPDALAVAPTGVFVGITTAEYIHLAGNDPNVHRLSGGMPNFAAGRLSYILGVRGPSMAVDTACSSSLTAVHLACQSLRAGECRAALAGGVNVIADADSHGLVAPTGSLSPDGRSRTFDVSANGMGRGEGCGVVLLKRLSDAVSDGDRLLAVIRGSAVGHYGKGAGFTVPNPAAQEALIRQALANAGVEPSAVSYIEAHGTGTPFGDLIEMQALTEVFRPGRDEQHKLVVGSVKTNIGHAESAAGMAGLLKIVLALGHGEIPPHIHLTNPNPEIPWQQIPVVVPRELMPWACGQAPRIAGLSGFGMSGAIAHVVVEQAPAPEDAPQTAAPPHILTLSAKSATALQALAERYRQHFEQHPEQSLANICFTANTGRVHHGYRAALVVASAEDACRQLADVARQEARDITVVRGAWVRCTAADYGEALETLAALYIRGVDVDWSTFHRDSWGRRVPLPTYCFQRQKYWFTMSERQGDGRRKMRHPLLGRRLESPDLKAVVFESQWSASVPGLMADHKVYGTVVAAGTSYFETALAGAAEAWGPGLWCLDDVMIREALVLESDQPREVQLLLRQNGQDRSFEIYSRRNGATGEGGWTLHVDGAIGVLPSSAPRASGSLEAAQAACRGEVLCDEYYRVLRERGLDYGPSFSNIHRLWRGDGEALGLVEPSDAVHRDAARFVFHPGMLDACCQVVGAASRDFFNLREEACVTIGFESLRVLGPVDSRLWCHAAVRSFEDRATLVGELRIYGEDGRRVAEISGICFKRVSADVLRRAVGRPKDPRAPLYHVEWRPKPGAPQLAAASSRYLILADRGGVGARLADLLEQQGGACTLMFPGASAAELKETVVEFLDQGGKAPGNVVYLWGLEAAGLEFTLGSLLEVAHAVAPDERTHLPIVWIATRNTQSVQAGPVAIDQAPLWGFPRAIAMEHPDLRCFLVDLDGADADAEAISLRRELVAGDGEDRVAIRRGVRHVARLAPLAAKPDGRVAISAPGTYLITGGTGALGLVTARWLVSRGARDLALLSRHQPSAGAAQAIAELEARGARVRILTVDVSDRKSLAAAIADLPLLRGVVHSAGALADALLEQQDWQHFRTVLASKVTGAWNLHELTATRRLDFFVLYSSGASLLGSPAQTNYCAANAYLDALAHYRRALFLPALSINWGPWKELGMAANPAIECRWRAAGVRLLTPEEGAQALEVLLGQDIAQAGVLPIDWERALEKFPGLRSPFFAGLVKGLETVAVPEAPAASKNALLDALAAAPAGNHRKMVFDFVRGQVLKMLGREPSSYVDERQPLNELGFDSLMAVEIKNVLGLAVGRTLSAGMVYLYPNIHALGEYLATDVLKLPVDSAAPKTSGKISPVDSALLEEVEQLTEEELNRRLAEFAGEEFLKGSHE